MERSKVHKLNKKNKCESVAHSREYKKYFIGEQAIAQLAVKFVCFNDYRMNFNYNTISILFISFLYQ
jgi:hypothetical protein